MLFKSTLVLAFVALANVAAAVQTPACVLKVMGNTNNPADLKTICGSDSKKIISNLQDACGDSDSALKFFSNTCKEHGHEVDISKATDGSSTSASASASATGSGFVTAASTSGAQATGASGSSSGSSSGSATSSSAATATPSTAGAIDRFEHVSGTAFAAAVFLGAAALL